MEAMTTSLCSVPLLHCIIAYTSGFVAIQDIEGHYQICMCRS